jgi:hypothetical protein
VLTSHAGVAQDGVDATDAANTDNRLESFVEPQCGHGVPFQRLERTRISLSRPHLSQ